jgi:hypothetical protein
MMAEDCRYRLRRLAQIAAVAVLLLRDRSTDLFLAAKPPSAAWRFCATPPPT